MASTSGYIKLFDADHDVIKIFVFTVDNADNTSTFIHANKHFFVSIFGETGEDPDFKDQAVFSEYIQNECAQVAKVQLKHGERFVCEFNVNNPENLLARIRQNWLNNVSKKRAHVEYIEDESDDDEADSGSKRAKARARAIEVWKFSAELQKKLSGLAEQGKTMDDGEACLVGIQLASILKGDRLVFNEDNYNELDQMNIVNMCNDIGMSIFGESAQVTETQAASKAYDLVKLLCFQ